MVGTVKRDSKGSPGELILFKAFFSVCVCTCGEGRRWSVCVGEVRGGGVCVQRREWVDGEIRGLKLVWAVSNG